jgi:hypothetical protein
MNKRKNLAKEEKSKLHSLLQMFKGIKDCQFRDIPVLVCGLMLHGVLLFFGFLRLPIYFVSSPCKILKQWA